VGNIFYPAVNTSDALGFAIRVFRTGGTSGVICRRSSLPEEDTAPVTATADSLALLIAADGIDFGPDSAARWHARFALFCQLEQDTGLPAGPVIADFYARGQAGNFGKITRLHALLADARRCRDTAALQQAQQWCAAITPTHPIEAHLQRVAALALSRYPAAAPFTAAQVAELQALAQLCPFTDGPAVYQARVLLTGTDTTEYFHACELTAAPATAPRLAGQPAGSGTAQVSLYPNPTAGELIITTTLAGPLQVNLYSLLGNPIAAYAVEAGSAQPLSLRQVESGAYLYKVIHQGAVAATGKLIIIR
jgi:hypothetical protein